MDEKDRRRASRIPCILEAAFSSQSPFIDGRLTDLTPYGVFIDTMTTIPPGSEVTVKFGLPELGEIKTKGKVVWTQDNVGMGVEFLDLSPEDHKKIEDFSSKSSAPAD